jgi:hypothetical protein
MMLAIAWISATAIGFALGGFVLHFPGSFGGLAAWDPAATLFGGILGFATGVGVALVQWVGLRLPRRSGTPLLLAMGLSIGITHGLQDGAPASIGLLVVAAVSGVAVAAIFAVLFDQRAPAEMLASAFGWGGGQLFAAWLVPRLGLPWHETPLDWSLAHLASGIVIAIAWAVPTALAGLPAAIHKVRGNAVGSPFQATG